MLVCPYCNGEVVEPPALAGMDRAYVCMKCQRRLSEKNVIVDDQRIPEYTL